MFAGIGAEKHQIPGWLYQQGTSTDNLAKQVLHRFVDISVAVAELTGSRNKGGRELEKQLKRQRPPKRASVAATSKHSLAKHGNQWICSVCNIAVDQKQLIPFVHQESPCLTTTLEPTAEPGILRVIGNPPVIYGSVTHLSHVLLCHRGIVWCTKCGCLSMGRTQALRNECRRACTARGSAQARRLANCTLPHEGMEWPDTDPLRCWG